MNNLDEFYQAGVRYIGLAHFFDNEWAGSAHGIDKGGLTKTGKQLIKKMDSLNIIIDLAHSSAKTIDEIFALTQSPVIVSHTGVQAMCRTGPFVIKEMCQSNIAHTCLVKFIEIVQVSF